MLQQSCDECDEPDGTGRNADAEVKSNGAMQSCSPDRHRATSTYWMASVANNRQAHRRKKKRKKPTEPIYYKTLIRSYFTLYLAQIMIELIMHPLTH